MNGKVYWIYASALTSSTGAYTITVWADQPVTLYAKHNLYAWESITLQNPPVESASPQNFTLLYLLTTTVSPEAFNTTPKTLTFSVYSTAPQVGSKVLVQVPGGSTVELAFDTSYVSPSGWARWQGNWTVPSGTADALYTYHACILDGMATGACVPAPSSLLSQVKSEAYALDTVVPVFSAWLPTNESNTLWKRQPLGVTISDVGPSGLDAGSIALTLDGSPLASSYSASTGRLTATPTSDLAVDQDHEVRVRATDLAGNVSEGTVTFRVMRVLQETLEASIPDVKAPVPTATECQTNCSVIFKNPRLSVGSHKVTVSATAHAGSGKFRRPVSLAGAVVVWTTAVGNATTAAGLPSTTVEDTVWLDDAFDVSFSVPFQASESPLADVAVQVPADAVPGSEAILRMTPGPVSPLCTDTWAAGDPGTCGGTSPTSDQPDPLPDPALPSPLDEDITVGITYEQLALTEERGMIPALPSPPDDPENEILGRPFPVVDPSIIYPQSRRIGVEVKTGEDIYAVVASHGGTAADVHPAVTGPIDDIDRGVGLDRSFYVDVPAGQEPAKALEYMDDPKVDYSFPVGDVEPTVNELQVNDELQAKQWNLFGSSGLHMRAAWAVANYGPAGSRPINGIFGNGISVSRPIEMAVIDSGVLGSHRDLTGKIDTGYDFINRVGLAANADSESDCRGGHGTAVAGVNARTNNGDGVAGVDYAGHIIPIRVFGGNCATFGTRAEPIRKAVELKAEVINMSYEGPTRDDFECKEILAAWRRGLVIVTSYAQLPDQANWFFPGRCGVTLTTTASDRSGKGPTFRVVDEHVDVAAPGVKVPTTSSLGNAAYHSAEGLSGTSYAAAHVSGVAQLLKAMGAPNFVVFNSIRRSATPVSWCPCGKMNALRAVKPTLKNGVFELWSSDLERPSYWTQSTSGGCGSGSPTFRDSADTTYDGVFSMRTQCRGSGYHDVYQFVEVSNGWTYRFRSAARISGIDPRKLRVGIAWYDWKGANIPGGCSEYGDKAGLTASWKEWSILCVAPGGAVKARMVLRTYGDTGTGAGYWDDAGLYAFGRRSA